MQSFIAKHPDIKTVSGFEKSKSSSIFNNKVPLVLINTEAMSHASCYKYKPVIRKAGIPIKYIK